MTTNDDDDNKDVTDLNDYITKDHLQNTASRNFITGIAKPSYHRDEMTELLAK